MVGMVPAAAYPQNPSVSTSAAGVGCVISVAFADANLGGMALTVRTPPLQLQQHNPQAQQEPGSTMPVLMPGCATALAKGVWRRQLLLCMLHILPFVPSMR
jgi:hypothetical protein